MSLKSLIDSGTKLWLDSVEPELVKKNRALGISGATSNPIIITDIIKAGGLDEQISRLMDRGLDDSAIAWELTDQPVRHAQNDLRPGWASTKGNDRSVSFLLDPLQEDVPKRTPKHEAVRE